MGQVYGSGLPRISREFPPLITDTFFKRHAEYYFYASETQPEWGQCLRQIGLIISQDVWPLAPDREALFNVPHSRLTRELGIRLAQGDTANSQCAAFIVEPYNLWDDAHRDAEWFLKTRLSLIELIFREAESQLQNCVIKDGQIKWFNGFRTTAQLNVLLSENSVKLVAAIGELNYRLREAKLPFSYHNGMLQLVDDDLSAQQIENPFWELMADPKWRNVDSDIKNAIDRRDSHKTDAAFPALKAVESTIKIICGTKGWSTGKEIGAGAFIAHLTRNNFIA